MTYSELLKSELGKKQNVIYKFENLINGKVYIGQTRKQLRERIALHLCESKGNRLTYFHKSINKYGLSNFDITILEEVDDNRLLDSLEIYRISYYDSTNRNKGYNLTKGGSGIRPKRPNFSYQETEQTRKKRSQSAKLKWQSKEYRERYINSRKECKKVVQLDLNDNIIKTFSSISEAEKYIFGKKNCKLWEALCKKKLSQVQFNNCIWKLK